jgi:hypothetical protein
VQGALKEHSTRITARDRDTVVSEDTSTAKANLVLDPKGFLGS